MIDAFNSGNTTLLIACIFEFFYNPALVVTFSIRVWVSNPIWSKPVDYSQSVANLSQEMVTKLKTAVEIGRWENGDKLTTAQIESTIQAVMIWEAKHIGNKDAEPFVIGSQGELYTGKGESHKVATATIMDDDNLIAKNKV